MEKQKSESKRDPSYLAKDLLRLTMEKIPWKERVKLRLVCKSWKELFDEIQDTEEFLPWVMSFDWDKNSDGGICKLYDPSTRTSHIMKEPRERALFVDAQLVDSRCGWVLFSKLNGPYHLLFLYSPFTNEIIKFPVLDMEAKDRAAFSSNSSSSDCMVIVLRVSSTTLYIKTCHPGDKSWQTFAYSIDKGCYIEDLVYAGDFFYCIFSNLTMGTFNVKKQEWELLLEQFPANPIACAICVTFNGDLIIPGFPFDYHHPLWRFNFSEKKWVCVLEDENEIKEKHLIFSGNKRFFSASSSFSVPALGNARQSAGKIYDINFLQCISKFNHNSSPYEGMEPSDKNYEWMENYAWLERSQNYEQMEPSKAFELTKEDKELESIWIQPPFPNPLRSPICFNLVHN